MGSGNPPATLLRMCQANKAISLVLRQVHAALCPVGVTLDQFHFTASKQRHAAIKTMEGPDCFWIFKYGATSRHSHKVRSDQPCNCCSSLPAAWCAPCSCCKLAELGKARTVCYLAVSRAHPQLELHSHCEPIQLAGPSSSAKPLACISCLMASSKAEVLLDTAQASSCQGCCGESAAGRAQDMGHNTHSAE